EMSKRQKSIRGQPSSSYEISIEEKVRRLGVFEDGVRLYSQGQAIENTTLGRLRNCNTVREDRLLMEFWPRIGNGRFNVGNIKVSSIRDPRVKLAHRCIATTIAARKETTHRITEIDLYYLYCIYTLEVPCNIPYWLAKYFKGMREKNLVYGGMLSLIAIWVIMELHGGMCVWPIVMAEEEEDDEGDDEGDDGVGGDAGRGEAGGSADLYRNMSQGDCNNRQFLEF
ncbi:retrotransposon ORF1, partial [Tanacetum coccineum]